MSIMESIICPKDINEFVQNQGHGVKGLAELGIKSLPDQYIQPHNQRFNFDKVASANDEHLSIPIIDMSNFDDPNVEKQICDAAEKWGFLQVINHGVPLKELEDIKAAANRFFELPVEEKAKYLKKNSPTNNVRYGSSFVPEVENTWEWKDYLGLVCVSKEEALNHWPLVCREEALAYMKSTENITRRLLKILLKGLNIHDDMVEKKESLLMGSKRINPTFYPKCPNPELTFGTGSHSDASTLTILLQDDVGGLYVRGFDDETWVHVPPINGALVINIGDALQIFSNGKYKSVDHLVIPNATKNRISVPYFVYPSLDSILAPFQELIDQGEKPIYKGVLFADYIKHFFSKPHDGKATIQIASITE